MIPAVLKCMMGDGALYMVIVLGEREMGDRWWMVVLMAWKIFGAKRHSAISHQKKYGDSKTFYPLTGGPTKQPHTKRTIRSSPPTTTMVTFLCDGCNETIKKNKVDAHAAKCHSCYAVSCVDCSVSFPGGQLLCMRWTTAVKWLHHIFGSIGHHILHGCNNMF